MVRVEEVVLPLGRSGGAGPRSVTPTPQPLQCPAVVSGHRLTAPSSESLLLFIADVFQSQLEKMLPGQRLDDDSWSLQNAVRWDRKPTASVDLSDKRVSLK